MYKYKSTNTDAAAGTKAQILTKLLSSTTSVASSHGMFIYIEREREKERERKRERERERETAALGSTTTSAVNMHERAGELKNPYIPSNPEN